MSKSLAAAELRVDKAPSLFPGQLITNVIAGLQAKGVKLRSLAGTGFGVLNLLMVAISTAHSLWSLTQTVIQETFN